MAVVADSGNSGERTSQGRFKISANSMRLQPNKVPQPLAEAIRRFEDRDGSPERKAVSRVYCLDQQPRALIDVHR